MRVYSGTDIGRHRSVNQDYVYVSENPVGNLPNLFIVADGMGGHNAGDFASAFAVQVMVDSVKEDADFNPIKVIRHGIEVANYELIEQAKKSEERKGMGTTMVAATVVGNYVYVANVGDSRLYVVGEHITQITKDHSLVQEMVRMGDMTEEAARNHPDKNIITRALGAEEIVNIDFFDFRLDKDSNILMCSDGLSNMVSDEEIQKIIQNESDIQEKGKTLLNLANEHGGKDNIAVVLIEPFTEEVRKC